MSAFYIDIDCLGADHISCNGYIRKTTPNEDNNPLEVKEVFKNTGIIVQTRLGNPWDGWNSHSWNSLEDYLKKYDFP